MTASFPPPEFPPPSATPSATPAAPAAPGAPTADDAGHDGRPDQPDQPGRPGRRTTVVVGVALLALVAAAIGFLVTRGDDASDAASGGTTLEWDEAWRTDVEALDADPDEASDLLWADDDVALVQLTATEDDDESWAVVALDPGSGAELWSEQVSARFRPPIAFRTGDALVVVDEQEDEVGLTRARAFDVRTGDRLWRETDAGDLVVPVGDRIVMSRVHHPSEDVIADLLVVDAATGDAVFERAPSRGVVAVLAVRADGLVVIENDDGDWSVVGLSLDGDERWVHPIEFGFRIRPDVAPTIEGGTVVVADGDQLVGLGVDDGDERWSVGYDGDAPTVVPSTVNEVAVVCTERETGFDVVVRDLGTGDERWTQGFDGEELGLAGVSDTQLVVVDGNPSMGCSATGVFAMASSVDVVDLGTGEEAWAVEADDDKLVMLSWQTLQQQLTDPSPGLSSVVITRGPEGGTSVIDPITGDEVVSVPPPDDPGFISMRVVDGAVVAFRTTSDGSVVFDPLDSSRKVEGERLRVLGAGGDTLYLLDVDGVIAVR